MTDDAELPKRLGEVLRELRRAQGLSQERLAALAGIDRAYMGGLERGQRNPSLTTIARVARGLNLPMSEVLKALEGVRTPPTQPDKPTRPAAKTPAGRRPSKRSS